LFLDESYAVLEQGGIKLKEWIIRENID
jgi:hypothetical protein